MDDPLMEARYKMLLEQETRKFATAITELRDSNQRLLTELQAIKMQTDSMMQELNSLKSAGARPQAQPERQKTLEDKPATHPRQGNFKSEDVDIQKMFYFGHK